MGDEEANMKFLLALALAAFVALIVLIKNTNMPDRKAVPEQQLEKNMELSSRSLEKTDRQQPADIPDFREKPWNVIFFAINKVFLVVVAGFALGKLFKKTREFISSVSFFVLAVLVLLLIALNNMGLIEFKVLWQNFTLLFDLLKSALITLGLVNTIAIFLGLWSGLSTKKLKAIRN
jgi:uncharacterized membrane protein YbjE (DUF340 family)